MKPEMFQISCLKKGFDVCWCFIRQIWSTLTSRAPWSMPKEAKWRRDQRHSSKNQSENTPRGYITVLTADWLIYPSVCRMILKSDGIIPPPPVAPAPEPPASSNQVDVKSRVAAWSAWTNEQQDCEWCHIKAGICVFSDLVKRTESGINLKASKLILIS